MCINKDEPANRLANIVFGGYTLAVYTYTYVATNENSPFVWRKFFIWNDHDATDLSFVSLPYSNIIISTLTAPATYVTSLDFCFMNNKLQMTRFSPPVYSKILEPSAFLALYRVPTLMLTKNSRTFPGLSRTPNNVFPCEIEQGLTSNETHYKSYQGRVFTGQMTQPTVSQHGRMTGRKD